jgi:hypothetical protein
MNPIRSRDAAPASRAAAATLLALVLAACSAPAPAAPSAGPSSSPVVSPATATPSAPPTATPSPAPSAPVSAPPSVGLAPGGPWTRIAWIDAGRLPLGTTNVSVHGWSGGFIGLEQSGDYDENGTARPVVIRAAASSDGLTWSTPATFDTAGLSGSIAIAEIVEGPSGLLALGDPYGDTCGGPAVLVALWRSADGRAWQRVPMPRAFRAAEILTIAGGSAGFIATGRTSEAATPALWTSPNGTTWTSRPLPKVASGTLAIDGATSFGGGFVVAGSVLGEEGCGGAAHIRAATWWSADGRAWTRASLPGSLTDVNARLSVRAVNDRVLMIVQVSGDGEKRLAWTSADGRSWTPVAAPSELADLRATGDGRHTAMLIEPESGSGSPTALEIAADGRVTTLAQSGDGPVASADDPGWSFAVGPTGILVLGDDGGAAWLGVPG